MSVAFHRLVVRKTLTLSSNPEELRASFLAMKSRDDLATLLECSSQQLSYWTQIAQPTERYTAFEIRKANGSRRLIEAPSPVLAVLQRKLLQALEASFDARAPVQGFIKGRGILSNAARHTRRAWVLNLDLMDFFPTIHFGRVRGVFRAKPFDLPEPVATAIAQLTCCQRRLPQGAPTSPIISNIICSKMDAELRRLAKEQGAMYTRYADDITFSVRRRAFPRGLAAVVEPETGGFRAELARSLVSIIQDNGFAVNDAKVRISPWKRSQRVTGLVVNRGPNVPREFVRRTRAMLHAWERYGLELAEGEFHRKFAGPCRSKAKVPSFRKRVRGNIAYIGQVRGRDDALYLRLLTKYHLLIGQPLVGVPDAMTNTAATRDAFICHASEDKKVVVVPLVAELERNGFSVWFDKAEIRWGDSLTGKINEGLATSRYVIVVLSPAFLQKEWARKELNAALAREIASGRSTLLPLMVGDSDQIATLLAAFPLQADKVYLKWSDGVQAVVDAFARLARPARPSA